MKQKIDYDAVKNRLSEYNLKATQQRIVIYESLMDLRSHPTAEMIYDLVRPGNPSISLATVYKTLDAFVSVGLATKVMSDEGNFRYDANMGNHNHIYCTNTKEIIDYEDKELDTLIENFFKNKNIKNLKIKDIRLQINGEKLDPLQEVFIK